MGLVSSWMDAPLLPREKLVESLEALIAPGDRIVLEGDNQKQADFLSRSLVKVDPKKLHDLRLIISSISRPEHLILFELGIARKVDFAFAGPQSLRVAQLLEDGVLEIGAIHKYVELYARLYIDLPPNVHVENKASHSEILMRGILSVGHQPRFNASGTGGRCSPLLSLAYGTHIRSLRGFWDRPRTCPMRHRS
jgi:hypothetical protein